jgi:glycosyltransferase involved in cell wall biosynthesis
MTRPPITVVIPTRNRPDMLDRALTSVRAAAGPDDELLVVDSASDDAAAIVTVADAHGARVVRCDRKGETVARNAGWQSARYDAVAYCDDDVWVDEGWVEAMATAVAEHPEAGFVTGRIEVPPGQTVVGLAVSIITRPEAVTYDARTRGLLGHAASLAVRRTAMTDVGGFDEELGAGARFEAAPEGDLFDRLFAAGWSGRYEPAALAWHDQWRRRLRVIVRLDYGYGKGSGARMAKLVKRRQVARLRVVAHEYLWAWGLTQLARHAVARDKFLFAATAARLGGIVVGFVTGVLTPVRRGHYRGRRAASST